MKTPVKVAGFVAGLPARMKTPVKVAGFVAGLAAVFGLAILAGAVVGPVGAPAASAHQDGTHTTGMADTTTDLPGGLMVTQNGYTFALADSTTEPGRDVPMAFTITGPDGHPVTGYDVQHEKQLHLIAVRRDFTGFQHVHPTLGADGTWRVGLDLTAGQWRLFADFAPTGADPLVLGADLSVPGEVTPPPPASESRTAQVDGYTITLDGDLTAGADTMLTLTVSHDGKPVTDLQPYLGAYGHLVALREGDLAYLHVHPDGEPGDGTTKPGPGIVFHTSIPSAGTYHLYLDFQHQGVVRTAEFTVTATTANPNTPSPSTPSTDQSGSHDHGGH